MNASRFPKSPFLVGCLLPNIAWARNEGSFGPWLLVALAALWLSYRIFKNAVSTAVERQMNERISEIEKKEREERSQTEYEKQMALGEISSKQAQLDRLNDAFSTSFIQGRRWLAELIAEAFTSPDIELAQHLRRKKHPAIKAAEQIKRVGLEKRELMIKLKTLEYTIKTYHEYFPILEQYSEDILNEQATIELIYDESEDAVKRYISREEYQKLSPDERSQRALDNWKNRPKSNVEVGRLYERYLGYLYETDGWEVSFFGATKGLEDMGRDLICKKGANVHIVQAKYWAEHRTIHEKHIFQLYGTCILVPHSNPNLSDKKITPVFITTTGLSDTANWAAQRLNVKVKRKPIDPNYPMIKCNINGREKIYHLPFDQQYDRVRIDTSKEELYVNTVAEAARLGFRRAMRFKGLSN